MNAALADLRHYLGVNKLMLNTRKTECMFPFTDTAKVLPIVQYNCSRLRVVSSFKYLGVHFDDRLTWKVHVDHLISTVKSKIYMMYRSRYYCSLKGRKLLFTAMLQPHFLYCADTWRCCNQTLSGAVEVLYRHCIRIALNDITLKPKLSNVAVYRIADTLPLSFDFQLRAACLLFATVKLKTDTKFAELFREKVSRRLTREGEEFLLEIPFARREHDRFAFRWWGCTLWNGIPLSIRNASDMNEFRRLYKQYMMKRLHSGTSLARKFYHFV
jgi:hypothetical protein